MDVEEIKKHYKELQSLRNKELSNEEMVDNYLTKLYVLFLMGAYKELREELERLEEFKDRPLHRNLTILLMIADGKFNDAEALIKKELSRGDQNYRVQLVWQENLAAVYINNGNINGYKSVISEIENLVFEHNAYDSKAFNYLMEFYDKYHLEDKAKNVIKAINKVPKKDFQQYGEYSNIIYLHYLRNKDYVTCRKLLDEFIKEESKEKDQDKRKIFEIMSLRDRLQLNYDWQKYSNDMFERRREFINASPKVYFCLLSTTLFIFQQASEFYHLSYDGNRGKDLLDDIAANAKPNIEFLDKSLNDLDDNFLYIKVNILYQKVEYCRLKEVQENHPTKYLSDKIEYLNQIIDLCRKNTNWHEMLHYINVSIDEIVIMSENMDILKYSPDYTDVYNDYLTKKREYLNDANEKLSMMMNLLYKTGLTRNNSYYVLYAAYNYLRLGNSKEAVTLFKVYKNLGVNINQYPISTRNIYRELDGLSNNKDVRNIKNLKSGLIHNEINKMREFVDNNNIGAAVRICNYIADKLNLGSGTMPDEIEPEVIMIFLNFQAFLYMRTNNLKSALAIIKQYNILSPTCITSTFTDGDHIILSSQALEATGRKVEALKCINDGIQKYKATENHVLLAQLYNYRGKIETDLNPNNHINSLCESLGEAEKVGNINLIANIYENLGHLFNKQDHPSLGMSFFRKCSAIYSRLKGNQNWFRSIIFQAESYHFMELKALKENKTGAAKFYKERELRVFNMMSRDELDERNKALYDSLKGEYTHDVSLLNSALNFYISAGANDMVANLENILNSIEK